MILVNKKQVNLNDLGKALGIEIPLDLIKKKPLYEINPALVIKDPANGPMATKCRQAMEFPCVFNTTLKNGEAVEIRYCLTRTPDPKTHGSTEKYSPRVCEFEGRAEFVKDDLDKAVFFWVHFYNKTSPFRQVGQPFEYELVDDDAKARELIEHLTLRGRAATHASALQGEQLMIIAKGMGIPGVQSMEPMMVKAQLMQFASDQPAEYLVKAESNVTHVKGLIVDSIDKGIFVLDNQFNVKRWRWGEGVRKGELLVEISNNVPDHNEALVTHISQHIQDILPVLMETAKNVNGSKSLEAGAKDIDVMAGLGLKDDEQPDGKEGEQNAGHNKVNTTPMALPSNYAEASTFLFAKIGSKAPIFIKKLELGVKDGSVTMENVDTFLATLKKQK